MQPHVILERLIYRDALMLVLNKPAGIPVHKGKGRLMASMEDYFSLLRFGLPRNPGLAHRLDKDTSGCLILGRHRKALEKLGNLFKQNKIKKVYWAVVEGELPATEGVINARIGKKNESDKNWHMMVRDDGQEAVTEYKVLTKKDGRSFVELRPQTGRTHQLRVHMAHLGCPIVGDYIYGKKSSPLEGEPKLRRNFGGGKHFATALPPTESLRDSTPPQGGSKMHLHAYSVEIPLYKNKDPILVIAEPPEWAKNYKTEYSTNGNLAG